jgi:hypothetical protein
MPKIVGGSHPYHDIVDGKAYQYVGCGCHIYRVVMGDRVTDCPVCHRQPRLPATRTQYEAQVCGVEGDFNEGLRTCLRTVEHEAPHRDAEGRGWV